MAKRFLRLFGVTSSVLPQLVSLIVSAGDTRAVRLYG